MDSAPPYLGPNRLLRSLSNSDFKLLTPYLKPVSLSPFQLLEIADEAPSELYFLEGGLASVVAKLQGRKEMDVALIGREGTTGTSMLSGSPSPFNCYALFEGSALALPTRRLPWAIENIGTLRGALGLYAHTLSVQTAYTALAGVLASTVARLARALLMISDRIDGESFEITHEMLSKMLGVRRPGVTTALHTLEGQRMIKATRGKIEILNRAGLMALVGEAYSIDGTRRGSSALNLDHVTR